MRGYLDNIESPPQYFSTTKQKTITYPIDKSLRLV